MTRTTGKKYEEYNMNTYIDTPELDIEAILDESSLQYHYKDGKMTVSDDKTYYSAEEIREMTRDYNSNHTSAVHADQAKASKRKIAREMRKRVIETSVAVITLILAGVFCALMLYPQAELSEMSRDNSDLKDEISALKKEIISAEENSNGITDMDSVRAQAIALGMQEPNANQVVVLPMPGNDRLVSVVSVDSYGINQDALDTAQGNLAQYYHDADGADN